MIKFLKVAWEFLHSSIGIGLKDDVSRTILDESCVKKKLIRVFLGMLQMVSKLQVADLGP